VSQRDNHVTNYVIVSKRLFSLALYFILLKSNMRTSASSPSACNNHRSQSRRDNPDKDWNMNAITFEKLLIIHANRSIYVDKTYRSWQFAWLVVFSLATLKHVGSLMFISFFLISLRVPPPPLSLSVYLFIHLSTNPFPLSTFIVIARTCKLKVSRRRYELIGLRNSPINQHRFIYAIHLRVAPHGPCWFLFALLSRVESEEMCV
jgi:hypothetical protein